MRILILLSIVATMGCSGTKNLSESTQGNIEGYWANSKNQELQVVLSINESSTSINLNILGEEMIALNYKEKKNQTLIKFKNQKGDIYHLLAQTNSKNEMRMSITMESVPEFVPVGQLGEHVYKLYRIENTPHIMAKSTPNKKRLN